MKVTGLEIEGWEQKSFEKLKDKHEVVLTEAAVTENLESRFRDADIISTFIYPELNEKVLAQFENLKFISTRSTGVNHIDADYCRQHRISVSSAPAYGQNTLAEHAFALIHALSRHIPEAVTRTRSGNFSQEGLQGFDLKGKVLGVIGTGDIGKNVIRIAYGYQMEVLAFDVKQDEDAAGEDGDFQKEVKVIEDVDRLLLLVTGLEPDVLAVIGDHSTPAVLKSHSWHPVPIVLFARWCRADRVREFSEPACLYGGLGRFPAVHVMPLVMANARKLKKFGA